MLGLPATVGIEKAWIRRGKDNKVHRDFQAETASLPETGPLEYGLTAQKT
jgi:hypothetical protein